MVDPERSPDPPDPRPPEPEGEEVAPAEAPSPDVGEQAAPAPRLLRRSSDDQVIAGVAGGLGRYVGVDPVILRLGFVLLTLAGGAGIVLYLVLAAVIPRERPGEETGPAPELRARGLTRVIGWILILAGAVFLVGRFVPELEQLVWPVALLGLGMAVLVHAGRSGDHE